MRAGECLFWGEKRSARIAMRISAVSRPSGEWRDDDYDVLIDGVVVGRIM